MLRTMTFKKLTLGVALCAGLLSVGSVSFAQGGLFTVNPGFETAASPSALSTTGFATQYTEVAPGPLGGPPFPNPLYPESTFSIVANSTDIHDQLHDQAPDYDANTGENFMIVNGATAGNTIVWAYDATNTNGITGSNIAIPGLTQYDFSVWVSTWSNPGLGTQPQLQLQISESTNGGTSFTSFQDIGAFFSGPTATTGTWEQRTVAYIPSSSSVNVIRIRLEDTNTAEGGNDFGLDDFSFQPVPATDGVTSLGIGGFVCLMGHLQMRRRKAAKAKKS